MSQFYEIMTILSPNESEEGVEAIIGGLRQQLTTSGAEILAVDVWGKRRLAYPINKFDEGTYVLFHAEGPANVVADFRQHTRIRESILRELIIKLDGAYEVAVRTKLAEQEPEDEAAVEAQIEAAEQRAVEKLAQVTAPVTDATAAAGVEIVAATDLDAPAEEDATAEEDAAAEAVTEEVVVEEVAAAVVDEVVEDEAATADSEDEAATADSEDDAATADSEDDVADTGDASDEEE